MGDSEMVLEVWEGLSKRSGKRTQIPPDKKGRMILIQQNSARMLRFAFVSLNIVVCKVQSVPIDS